MIEFFIQIIATILGYIVGQSFDQHTPAFCAKFNISKEAIVGSFIGFVVGLIIATFLFDAT